MYYNKEAYKFEDLTEENKKILSAYDFAIEDASNKEFIVGEMLECFGDDSTLGKIRREIAEEAVDAVVDYLKNQREYMLVSFLDSQAAEEDL